jgi:hypothetical protein
MREFIPQHIKKERTEHLIRLHRDLWPENKATRTTLYNNAPLWKIASEPGAFQRVLSHLEQQVVFKNSNLKLAL